MPGLVEGKVALVTGAGSGIGRAAALVFARERAKVVVVDVQADGGEETVQRIQDTDGEALFVHCDVSLAEQVEAMVKRTVEVYGRLDCAFNNAGTSGRPGLLVECAEENWERIINTNLKGIWLCLKYEIQQMLQQGSGAIVNCASALGLVGRERMGPYVASKHGIIGLTRTAALEYAKAGIRVNAVCPGPTRTPALERFIGGRPEVEAELIAEEPVGRLGRPEEIGEAVVWLCSDAASFVTGHPMAVDGGRLAL